MDKKRENKINSNMIILFIIILLLILKVFCRIDENGSILWTILIKESIETFFRLTKYIMIILFIIAICISILPKNTVINSLKALNQAKTNSLNLKKLFVILLFISLVTLDSLTTDKNIYIKNEVPNYLNFKINLIKDGILLNTKTVSTSNLNFIMVSKRIARGTRIFGRNSMGYYIKYSDENGNIFSSNEDYTTCLLANQLLKKEKKIIIEYYENTGIIKSIDGINKFDYDSLTNRINNSSG